MSRRFFDEALRQFNISLQEIDCKFILNESNKFKTQDKLEDIYMDVSLSSGNLTLCYEISRFCSMYTVPKSKQLVKTEQQMDEIYKKMDSLKDDGEKIIEVYNDLKQLMNKRNNLEAQKNWNLICIDNMDVLKEFVQILKGNVNIDLSDKIDLFESTANAGLKENFNKYGSMYKNLEELFTMNEGEYDIGDADSVTIKEDNIIYMKDTQHPVFFKIMKQDNDYTLYINHDKASPDNNYNELDKETLKWEKVLLLKENNLEVNKLYFNELGHLKYLVEPTLGQEELFTKTTKLKM